MESGNINPNDQFFQMIEKGDIQISQLIQSAFLIMGMTKRGKTTLGHYLCGQLLKGVKKNGVKFQKQSQKNYKKAIIGSKPTSQTQIPNYFYPKINGQKFTVIDCPGFADSQGYYKLISNSYFIYRVFSKVKSIKFIITIQQIDLQKPIDILKTLKEFFGVFVNIKDIKDNIINACVLVISKSKRSIKEIKDLISGLIDDYKPSFEKEYLQLFRYFLSHIIKNQKIYLFKHAQEGRCVDINQLIAEINTKITQPWSRNTKCTIVDTSNLRFNILQFINTHNPDNKRQLLELYAYLEKKFRMTINRDLVNTLKAITEDALDGGTVQTFLKIMDKTIAEKAYSFDPIYETQRTKLKDNLFCQLNKKKYCEYWLCKMMVTSEIQTLLRDNQSLQKQQGQIIQKRSIQWLQEASSKLLNIFKCITNLAINASQLNTIKSFCYIIFRNMEDIKVLFMILKGSRIQNTQFPDFVIPLNDCFQGILSDEFLKGKIKFALNYQIKAGLQPQTYSQIAQLFEKIVPKQQNSSQISILKIKQIKLQINSSQYYLKSKNQNQILYTIKNFNKIRQQLQQKLKDKLTSQKQKQQIYQLLIQSIKSLGQFLKSLSKYTQAISCFKSIYAINKVIQLYQIQLSKITQRQKRKDLLIIIGTYASENGRIQYALIKFQQAYFLAKNYQDIKHIGQLIVLLSTGQLPILSSNYLKFLIKDQHYSFLEKETISSIEQLKKDIENPLPASRKKK